MKKYKGYFVVAFQVTVEAEDEGDALHELDDTPLPECLNNSGYQYLGTLLENREEGLIVEAQHGKLEATYQ